MKPELPLIYPAVMLIAGIGCTIESVGVGVAVAGTVSGFCMLVQQISRTLASIALSMLFMALGLVSSRRLILQGI
jgi:hypothetical protein